MEERWEELNFKCLFCVRHNAKQIRMLSHISIVLHRNQKLLEKLFLLFYQYYRWNNLGTESVTCVRRCSEWNQKWNHDLWISNPVFCLVSWRRVIRFYQIFPYFLINFYFHLVTIILLIYHKYFRIYLLRKCSSKCIYFSYGKLRLFMNFFQ